MIPLYLLIGFGLFCFLRYLLQKQGHPLDLIDVLMILLCGLFWPIYFGVVVYDFWEKGK